MDHQEQLLASAREHLKAKQWDQAVDCYTQILSLDNSNVEALFQLGNIAQSAGLSSEADELLSKIPLVSKQTSEPAQHAAYRKDATGSITRLGNDNCGWNCIPEFLNSESIVYCAGCGEDISFDLEIMNESGCDIFAFDPTPRSIDFMKKMNLPESFRIYEFGFADFNGQTRFNPPVDPNHVSHTIATRPETASRAITVEMRRLVTVMEELGHDHIDLLKMDIEGAEYQVVKDILASGVRVDQLLVEYHHFLDSWSYNDTLESILLMLNAGYVLFSVHGHTDYCFVRADRLGITPLPGVPGVIPGL